MPSSETKQTKRLHTSRDCIAGLLLRVLFSAVLILTWQSAPSAQTRGLPEATGELKGTLKRGPDGRLQVEPDTQPPAPDRDRGPLRPPGSGQSINQSVAWAHQRLREIRGYDHDRHVRVLQQQIDDLVKRERRSKGFGSTLKANQLTPAEKQLVASLMSRDREVRQHETRHYEMGRPYTQLPKYWFVTGPDGRRYVVSGSVSFAFRRFSREAETLLHQMTVLQQAALAPREPSPQDLAVARALGKIIQDLRNQLAVAR